MLFDLGRILSNIADAEESFYENCYDPEYHDISSIIPKYYEIAMYNVQDYMNDRKKG